MDFVRRLIEAGRLEAGEYQRVRVHRIHDAKTLVPLGSSSKLNAEWAFLTSLRDAGRRAADIWLKNHFDDIGERDTVDLRAMFEGEEAEHGP